MIPRTILLLAALTAPGAASLVACSSSKSSSDAGTPVDAGKMRDAAHRDVEGVLRDTGAVDAGVTTDASVACTETAQVECNALNQCDPASLSSSYGDVGGCVNRLTRQCLYRLEATGTTDNLARVVGCAAGYAGAACPGLLDTAFPDGCAPLLGTIPIGTPCWSGDECASGYCALTLTSRCGVCATEPDAGAPCTGLQSCGTGRTCFKGVCASWVTVVGQTCGATRPCGSGLDCVTPFDGGTGTCRASASVVGAPCDPAHQLAAGCGVDLYCDSSNTSPTYGTCQARPTVTAGESCKGLAGRVPSCVDLSSCVHVDGGDVCVARAADGQPCNTVTGPACGPPAKCIGSLIDGGSSGTCVFPEPTVCP